MQKEFLPGPGGYAIPIEHALCGKEPFAALVCHGLGSGKHSGTVLALREALAKKGAGVLSLDLPAHGESPVEGERLCVEGALDDIAAAEARLRALAPGARIVYFGSSFGAYLLLLYLGTRPHAGKKAFLRSAATDMPALFAAAMQPYRAELEARGSILLDEGYLRPLRITPAFVADLAAHDAYTLYRPGAAELAFIHGEADSVVPVECARRFAAHVDAPLTVLPGEEHGLSSKEAVQTVLRLALDFFEQE